MIWPENIIEQETTNQTTTSFIRQISKHSISNLINFWNLFIFEQQFLHLKFYIENQLHQQFNHLF